MATPGSVLWNADAAAHLLRRAAFGGTPEEAREFASLGMEAAVERLLAFSKDEIAPPATDPGESATRARFRREKSKANGMASEEEREFNREQRRIFDDMRSWWMCRMHAGPPGAREKLTLFWHGHFATSQTKVRFNHIMLGQNQTLRRLAFAPFRELCTAMACDPAMLVWLDGRSNKASAPNENFAREVMELFALGEGHYSEEDIREAARAFTGWRVDPVNGRAVFTRRNFDGDTKKILGKQGNFGAEEAVDVICSRPACAEFLTAKIWEFYAGEPPNPTLARMLASYYRARDLNTGDLLRKMFSLPDFYSPSVRGRQIKSPVQWLVQASRELGRQMLPPALAIRLAANLGQDLFVPPSVKGWTGGPSWINSATLIRRSNTARIFAVAAPPLPRDGVDSMDAAAWSAVAPEADRADAGRLAARLQRVFLAGEPSPSTRHKLEAQLQKSSFPCSDETVREASVVLLGVPEYQLC
ncbi:MAG: DUF1800 domain-containing protein [Chthoniobacterales bacterium]|nr:DUF1800 domain-containing protein [Chthoniobacterales bacterium]